MSTATICEQLRAGLPDLFLCDARGEYVRIRTPYLYPDGDNIDLFCKAQNGVIVVTDLGETTRWLRMQTTSPRRSPKQNALLQDAILNHGVEFYKGMLIARSGASSELAGVALRVAQAALRISDLWFTFRTRSIESVTDEVSDFLVEKGFDFERGEKLPGRSGRVWKPDFHVRATKRSSLVYVLSTGSRSAARGVVSLVHTAFYDLSHLITGPEGYHFISLFDDTTDVWSEEDFNLAGQLSSVTRWSKPDDLVEELEAA
jgi:hypothetical protein